MAIRIYVIEDHPAMRETLVEYLRLSREFELCGDAATAEEALQDLPSANPTLVLLDLSLPDRSGFDVLPAIHAIVPVPCIILSGHRDAAYVERALAAGARGYVLKGKPQEIPTAIKAVVNGGIFVSEALRSVVDAPELE